MNNFRIVIDIDDWNDGWITFMDKVMSFDDNKSIDDVRHYAWAIVPDCRNASVDVFPA